MDRDPPRLTREQASAFFEVLYRGRHHFPGQLRDEGSGCWSIPHYHSLASFDSDELTRLVLLAHDIGVRVWIRPSRPRYLRIWISARLRGSGQMSTDHPTIEEAIVKFRLSDERPWYRALEAHAAGADAKVPLGAEEPRRRWCGLWCDERPAK